MQLNTMQKIRYYQVQPKALGFSLRLAAGVFVNAMALKLF